MDVLAHFGTIPAPFMRGIVAELGYKKIEIPYTQQKRRAGKTHNNFHTLYDAAMLSFTQYTKFPIRFIMFFGIVSEPAERGGRNSLLRISLPAL